MNTASLNQIAYNILNNLRGGRSSHNDYLNLDQVKFAVKYYRALFIRRDQHRNFNRFRMFEQDLGLVEMETVDSAESDTYSSGNFLTKTKEQIPTPLRLKDREAITFVSRGDKSSKPIPVIDAHRVAWNAYNRFTPNNTVAFYRNGYIYIENDVTIGYLNIRGIFEDPEEVFEFTQGNGIDLYDENSPFPIPIDMLEQITKGLVEGELSLAVSTPNDETLDTLQGE